MAGPFFIQKNKEIWGLSAASLYPFDLALREGITLSFMSQIKDLLPDPPVNYSVSPQDSVAKAAQLMAEKNVGIVMVLEDLRLVGVFSERDLIRRVLAKGQPPEKVLVDEVMTRRVVIARAQDDPEMCLQKMEDENCRHLPVFSGEKPVGMLSIRDLMRYILSLKEDDLKMLEQYVTAP